MPHFCEYIFDEWPKEESELEDNFIFECCLSGAVCTIDFLLPEAPVDGHESGELTFIDECGWCCRKCILERRAATAACYATGCTLSELDLAPDASVDLKGIVSYEYTATIDTSPENGAMCPDCGSERIHVIVFDSGVCSETGYHDCGERFQCRDCGSTGDPGDLRSRSERHAQFGAHTVCVGNAVIRETEVWEC